METLLQDLRYGLRTHWKTKGLTIVVILTLALGIGSSTTVFSVIDSVLLKRLPYRSSQQIMVLWRLAPIGSLFGNESYPWSPRDFRLFLESSNTLEDLAAFRSRPFNLTGSGDPALLDGMQVTAGFFPVLGIRPIAGRTFGADEDQPGHEHVVVLSYGLWHTRFRGDPGIVGQTIDLNGAAYVVVGVMPPNFSFPHAEEMPVSLDLPRLVQLWVPMALPPSPRGPDELGVIGRLKPGMPIGKAQEEANIFQKRLESEFSQEKGWLCRVVPLEEQAVGSVRRPLILVLGAVAMVLLVACSNVANLLLVRSIERRQEFTLRAALGARQSRLIRQLLTESLALTLIGGTVGVVLAFAGVHLLKVFGPADLPRLQEVGIDVPVFLFALGIMILAGLFFGLAPAIAVAQRDLNRSLKEGRQRSSSSTGARIRSGLAVAQVTIALILVIAAGLLIRTFYQMLQSNPGFNPERVLTFELSLPATKYTDTDRMAQTYHKVLQDLRSVSGVQFAGLASAVPMAGSPDSSVIRVPDFTPSNDQDKPYANYLFVSPDYFSTLGTPLLQGRDFTEMDTLNSPPVTLINQTMAKKFWPGGNALGKQVGVANLRWPTRTIVGIVADVKRVSLREEPAPEMYVPYTQNEIKIWPTMQIMQFALRTRSDPAFVRESVQKTIHSIDPDVPIANLATMNSLVDSSMIQPRFSMLLLGSFAVLALLLASIGLYGVISYAVRQRTQEIGIRMALGADRRAVFRMVLLDGGRLAGLGIVLGITAALVLTRFMAKFLYGVAATDPLTFMAVSLLLLIVAVVASYVPARRATRINPVVALRCE